MTAPIVTPIADQTAIRVSIALEGDQPVEYTFRARYTDRSPALATPRTLYKVVDTKLDPCNGGHGRWSVGKWRLAPAGAIVACSNGLHVTDAKNLGDWLTTTSRRLFEVEVVGPVIDDGNKCVAAAVRLAREIVVDDALIDTLRPDKRMDDREWKRKVRKRQMDDEVERQMHRFWKEAWPEVIRLLFSPESIAVVFAALTDEERAMIAPAIEKLDPLDPHWKWTNTLKNLRYVFQARSGIYSKRVQISKLERELGIPQTEEKRLEAELAAVTLAARRKAISKLGWDGWIGTEDLLRRVPGDLGKPIRERAETLKAEARKQWLTDNPLPKADRQKRRRPLAELLARTVDPTPAARQRPGKVKQDG